MNSTAPVVGPRPLIAVVDDDESIRRSLTNLLSSSNYRVETFVSAEAFLAVVAETHPQCIILDLRMGTMSGIDLLAELLRQGSLVPVIMLTAFGNVELRRQAAAGGAKAFLTKPFQPDALLDAVAAFVGSS